MRRVLIADDHAVYRAGLVVLVQDVLQPDAIDEAASLDEALEKLEQETSDFVVLDLNMPGMEDVASMQKVKIASPDARLVVHSASDDRANVLGALSLGANGYIWKGEDHEEIERALTAIAAGAVYVPPFLAQTASPANEPTNQKEPSSNLTNVDLDAFTPRQRDVLTLLAEGKSNKEIARDLDLAESTVKIHLAAVFRVLGARNRTQAVLLAQGHNE